MKRELKISVLATILLLLTQFSIADIQTDEQQAQSSSEPKPLKVEEGATKVGEDTPKAKTRSLKLEFADEPKPNVNMNIGKLEFIVK